MAHSLEEALDLARQRGENEVFIIDSGEIIAHAIELVERMYLTQVHAVPEADVFVLDFDVDEWVEIESEQHQANAKDDHPKMFTKAPRINLTDTIPD